MKTTIIQLEAHDDVITVRDRLAWAKSARVVLIWPDEGRILTRLLDLVLIQRTGRQQNQQIGLVTHDPEVLEHARELGIPVFRNQKRALRGIWRRKPQRMRLLRPRRSFRPPSEELRKILPDRTYRPIPGMVRIFIFSLAFLAVIFLILFLMPAATIYLPLEKTSQEMVVSIWLNPELSGITLAGGVPVRLETVVIEEEGEISSTGRVSLPDQTAKGEVVFTNLTDAAVAIPKGTVVLTTGPESIRYLTLQPTNLVGGTGQIVSVGVEAAQAGKVGNAPAGTIQAVEGAIGLQVRVDNPQPVSGGSDRSQVSPSAADEAKLRQQMSEKMVKKAAEWLRGIYVEGAYTIEPSITQNKVLEDERFPAEGQPSESLRLRLKVEYQGWVVMGEDLRAVANNMLDANLPQGMVGVEDTILLIFGDTYTPEENGLRWSLTAKRQIEPILEKEQVIEQVLGKPRQQVLAILLQQFLLRAEPTILISPGWWPWLPVIESQIRVEVQ